MNVGLIGCGAIGGTLAQAIIDGRAGDAKLVAICDNYDSKIKQLHERLLKPALLLTTNPNELISKEGVELVIEAASQETVHEIAKKALKRGKNLMIMSVGALRDKEFTTRIEKIAKDNKVKIYVPSGAICGLDGVKAASIGEVTNVEITTTKHPQGLEGAPYLVENNIRLTGLKEQTIVYHGKAKEAAKDFPKNVNVAVALSLAGIGVDNTIVKIIVDPHATVTKHEIKVSGDFGELNSTVNNFTHPENPKTSYLAALAAISTLKKLTASIQVGT